MREILFKAKRVDNGEWVEGNLVLSNDAEEDFRAIIIPNIDSNMFTKHIGFKEVSCDLGFEKWYKVDKNTICQFTGLTDKNGKRIWENDIVKYHFGKETAVIKFGEYRSCFDSAKSCHVGFYVEWKNNLRKDLGYWVKMIDCNVIGNKFDNPELLEGSNV